MNYQPDTIIRFCRTGIDEQNKIVCHTQQELFDCMTKEGTVMGIMEKSSFQRIDSFAFQVRVDHNDIPYYNLLKCDTIFYINDETASFYIVGNILKVDWKNDSCSFVTFKVDAFMTYQTMISWDTTFAYIEREHIKNDWSSDGGNPLYSNFGPSEGFGTQADVPFYIWKKNFTPENVCIQSPYSVRGETVFNGQVRGHLYTSLQSVFAGPNEANSFFEQIAENKDCSINNIVGVFGIPNEWFSTIANGGSAYGGDKSEEIPAVNVAAKSLPSMIEYNNAKCWAAPFTVIRLMSSDGDSKDFNPQWLGNDQDEYTVRYRAAGAGGMFGGAQCTFMNKNGAFNWDGWNDFIVALSSLPNCPWTADGFKDWQSVNGNAAVMGRVNAGNQSVISALNELASTLVGMSKAKTPLEKGAAFASGALNEAGIISDAINTQMKLAASIQQEKSTGAAVQGGGTFNPILDVATDNWGFKIVYYSTQIYAMKCVDNYFDRFGYLINKLKKLEIENRPIWTYVKTIECHVNSTTGIPFIYESAINNMFNSGVTFWRLNQYLAGQKIGDFSKAHDNRGIGGG